MLAGAVFAGAGVLLYSPVFTVRNIIVSQVSSQAAEERIVELVRGVLDERPLGFLPAGSLALFRGGKAREALQDEFYLETVTFVRHWPNVLKVLLPGNVVVAEWQTPEGVYLVDRRGVLVQQVDQAYIGGSLVRIVDAEEQPRSLGDKVLEGREVEFVEEFGRSWSSTLDDVPLAQLSVEANSLPTFRAHTAAGWYALVSSESDVTAQVVALRRLLDEKLKDQQRSLLYMDVRFGSRLYYKLKE